MDKCSCGKVATVGVTYLKDNKVVNDSYCEECWKKEKK